MYHSIIRYLDTRGIFLKGESYMVRKPERKNKRFTNHDHRPMIPELRMPGDNLDTNVREARRRYDDVNPNHKNNWR